MKLNDFSLKLVDIIYLFVVGFTFFIMAINVKAGLSYFGFLFIGSIYIMVINYFFDKKKRGGKK